MTASGVRNLYRCVLYYSYSLPDNHTPMKYHVERSIRIHAPKDAVKPLIQDFNHWNSWSPWTIAEPDCPIEIKGDPEKPGHSMRWDGKIIGSGENVLVANDDHSITYDLSFLKPFKSKAKTAFHLQENNGETQVTWTMDSKMPFFLFFMVPTMKAWIGMDYDRGLRMLKGMAEEGSINATTTNQGLVDLKGFSYVGIKRTVSFDGIGDLMQKDFDTLTEYFVHKHDIVPEHWVALYPKMNMKKQQMTYVAAISDEGLGDVPLSSEYVRGEVASSKALEIKHDGTYDFIGNAWGMGMMYLRARKIKQSGTPFEKYWNNPKEVPAEDLKTSVYFPVKS